MKEQKTIYVVVVVDASINHPWFHIYTKESSDREKMYEYKKEIMKKHPDLQVGLLSKAKAKREEQRFEEWFHRVDKEQRKNNPVGLSTYYSQNTGVHSCSVSKRISKTVGLF